MEPNAVIGVMHCITIAPFQLRGGADEGVESARPFLALACLPLLSFTFHSKVCLARFCVVRFHAFPFLEVGMGCPALTDQPELGWDLPVQSDTVE